MKRYIQPLFLCVQHVLIIDIFNRFVLRKRRCQMSPMSELVISINWRRLLRRRYVPIYTRVFFIIDMYRRHKLIVTVTTFNTLDAVAKFPELHPLQMLPASHSLVKLGFHATTLLVTVPLAPYSVDGGLTPPMPRHGTTLWLPSQHCALGSIS